MNIKRHRNDQKAEKQRPDREIDAKQDQSHFQADDPIFYEQAPALGQRGNHVLAFDHGVSHGIFYDKRHGQSQRYKNQKGQAVDRAPAKLPPWLHDMTGRLKSRKIKYIDYLLYGVNPKRDQKFGRTFGQTIAKIMVLGHPYPGRCVHQGALRYHRQPDQEQADRQDSNQRADGDD